MRVMPLGTSSGRPTARRNMAALAVDLERSWLLVDCGEGTQHQVLRSPLSLHRLDGVLVTHLHGDHVLGLPGLLATMALDGRDRPLVVVGPAGLAGWLELTASLPMLGLSYELEVHELADRGLDGDDPELVAAPPVAGLTLQAAGLRHRVPCHGYRLTEADRPGTFDVAAAERLGVAPGPDFGRLQRGEPVVGTAGTVTPDQVLGPPRRGRVLAVFGDTAPCPAAVALARDADLVVHEATYVDDDADLAERWTHSTAGQAGTMARRAGAARLLLTHVSSRYADTDRLLADARATGQAADVAEELVWFDVPRPDTGHEPSGRQSPRT